MSLADIAKAVLYLRDPTRSLCSFLPSTHLKKPQSSEKLPPCFLKADGSTGHSAQFTFILLINQKYIIFTANLFHTYLPLHLISQILLLAARARFK